MTPFIALLGSFGLLYAVNALLLNHQMSASLVGRAALAVMLLIIGSLKRILSGGMAKGANYLYFRIPLQIFFIVWTYYFGIAVN